MSHTDYQAMANDYGFTPIAPVAPSEDTPGEAPPAESPSEETVVDETAATPTTTEPGQEDVQDTVDPEPTEPDNTESQQAEDAGDTASPEPSQEPVDEPNPYLQDYVPAEAEAEPETQVGTTSSQASAPQNFDRLAYLNEVTGSEYKDTASFRNEFQALQNLKSFLDSEGIQMDMLSAVQDGHLLPEELFTGQSMVEIDSLHEDDMAREAYKQVRPDASDEEVNSALAEMDPNVKALYANNRRKELRDKRTEHLNNMEMRRKMAKGKKDAEAENRQKILQSRQNAIGEAVSSFQGKQDEERYVAGTNVPMDDQMLATASKILMNPSELMKVIVKDLQKPDFTHALHQVMRILYPGKIAQSMQKNGASSAKRAIIEEHQNIKETGGSKSIAGIPPKSFGDALSSAWQQQFIN